MNKKLTLSCDIVMQGVEYASVNFSLKRKQGMILGGGMVR